MRKNKETNKKKWEKNKIKRLIIVGDKIKVNLKIILLLTPMFRSLKPLLEKDPLNLLLLNKMVPKFISFKGKKTCLMMTRRPLFLETLEERKEAKCSI